MQLTKKLFLLKKLLKDVFLSDNVFCPLPKWEQIERNFLSTPLLQLTRLQTVQELFALQIKGDAENSEVKNSIDGGTQSCNYFR